MTRKRVLLALPLVAGAGLMVAGVAYAVAMLGWGVSITEDAGMVGAFLLLVFCGLSVWPFVAAIHSLLRATGVWVVSFVAGVLGGLLSGLAWIQVLEEWAPALSFFAFAYLAVASFLILRRRGLGTLKPGGGRSWSG